MGVMLCAIIGIAFTVQILVMLVYLSRTVRVGPNGALILSGRVYPDSRTGEIQTYRVIKNGRAFAYPFLERVDFVSLEMMAFEIKTEKIYDASGKSLALNGMVYAKVADDDEGIYTFARHFLTKPGEELTDFISTILRNHIFELSKSYHSDELDREREKFARAVKTASTDEFQTVGLQIENFIITDIRS